MAAHTRRHASVLVVFVVFCVNMYGFAGFIRRTPPPTFSDTPVTDRHSDATLCPAQSKLGADILVCWIGKIVRTCAARGSRTLDILRERRTLYRLGQTLCYNNEEFYFILFIYYYYYLTMKSFILFYLFTIII